jgi:hypothetical protein
MYVEGVGQKSGPCTATFNDLLCFRSPYSHRCKHFRSVISVFVSCIAVWYELESGCDKGEWPAFRGLFSHYKQTEHIM